GTALGAGLMVEEDRALVVFHQSLRRPNAPIRARATPIAKTHSAPTVNILPGAINVTVAHHTRLHAVEVDHRKEPCAGLPTLVSSFHAREVVAGEPGVLFQLLLGPADLGGRRRHREDRDAKRQSSD